MVLPSDKIAADDGGASSALVLTLDPASPYAALELLAAMVWPEARERKLALATFAGASMGLTNEFVEAATLAITDSRQRDILLGRMAFLGVLNDRDKLACAWAADSAEDIRMGAESVKEQTRKHLFEPSGGYGAVAAAPGLAAIEDSVLQAILHGAVAAALQLLLVCRLSFHHDLTASLGRARTVVEHMTLADGSFGKERALKGFWTRWGPVTPVWAGVMVAGGYPWSQKGLDVELSQLLNGILDGLTTCDALSKALGYTSWFREFAASYVAPNARTPLIGIGDILDIRPSSAKERPPLPPLNSDELRIARDHEVVTVKPSEIGAKIKASQSRHG